MAIILVPSVVCLGCGDSKAPDDGSIPQERQADTNITLSPVQQGKPIDQVNKSGGSTPPAPAGSFKNTVGMTMVPIRAGSFRMGSPKAEQDSVMESSTRTFLDLLPAESREYSRKYLQECLDSEGPQHEVRISKNFYMAAHPVTVGQFRQFVADTKYQTDGERDGKGAWGYNPERKRHEGDKPQYSWQATGWQQTDRDPVVNVTWGDAVAFCKWLSTKESKTYRLPTEAEWEYACRAGTTTRYFFGDAEADLKGRANVADQSLQEKFDAKAYKYYGFMSWNDGYPFTSPVDRFPVNAWGLNDMHGNVCQWCLDWFDKDYYKHSPKDDPECTKGTTHVLRGGTWYLDARFCRAANRYESVPSARGIWVGFRVAHIPTGPRG
jgi:formylglycine-generating enzyme required for sulfatase activity